MNDNTMTIKGTLPVGVEYHGERHRDFELRLSTVGDEIDASEMGIPDSGYYVGLTALCLVSLGTIPPKEITYDLLRSMASTDYSLLVQARDTLKKKMLPGKSDSGNTVLPASGSASTDTMTPTSGS
ncbi:phage tail assembly protein [Salmonella enterica subsp. enterica]|nr:phage tail assembly protein [Salmonella enterica subsp. enterica serovar Miami]HDC2638930.1 phage tail assembly protein [Salmonella enterica]